MPCLEEFVEGSPMTDPVILITSSLFFMICMCADLNVKSPSRILMIATVNDLYDIAPNPSTPKNGMLGEL